MGLDDVELVMRLEEEFDVEMPVEFFEARQDWRRVDVLFYYLLYNLQHQHEADARCHRPPPETEDGWGLAFTSEEKTALWAAFRWVIADQLGVSLDEIQPDTDLWEDLDVGR